MSDLGLPIAGRSVARLLVGYLNSEMSDAEIFITEALLEAFLCMRRIFLSEILVLIPQQDSLVLVQQSAQGSVETFQLLRIQVMLSYASVETCTEASPRVRRQIICQRQGSSDALIVRECACRASHVRDRMGAIIVWTTNWSNARARSSRRW